MRAMTSIDLIARQSALLSFVRKFEQGHGSTPSYAEMKEALIGKRHSSPRLRFGRAGVYFSHPWPGSLPKALGGSMNNCALPRSALLVNRKHGRCEFDVEVEAISPGMHAPVAVWAKGYHVPRIVRAAICHPANVMWLEVRNPIRPQERGRAFASLAGAFCSRDYVITDVPAAFEYGRRCFRLAWTFLGGGNCLFSKLLKFDRSSFSGGRFFLHYLDNTGNRPQLEHHSVAKIFFPIGSAFDVMGFVDEFVFKSQASFGFGKKKQAFTLDRMFSNCLVAGSHRHVANLTFSEVFKYPFGLPTIGVSVFCPFFAGNDDNQGMQRGRDDAALLLTAKTRMNVFAPIVNPTALKAPTHRFPPDVFAPHGQFHFAGDLSMGEAA
ncbi:hypothetical protein FHS20_001248 [Phyllobacterium endophyticum]|nr:hypothetical protein [Phyllobacterium endophyticum]